MIDREKLGEIIRFGIVGVCAVVLQYGAYLLLCLKVDPIISNIVAYLISFCFNYFASVRYTFKVESSKKKAVGFALCHVVNFLLQNTLLWAYLKWGIEKEFAMIPVFAICVPTNFILVRIALKK